MHSDMLPLEEQQCHFHHARDNNETDAQSNLFLEIPIVEAFSAAPRTLRNCDLTVYYTLHKLDKESSIRSLSSFIHSQSCELRMCYDTLYEGLVIRDTR